MGCSISKVDHLSAVSLCRGRCHSLDNALSQSYILADAHVAYLRSLRAFGCSLSRMLSSRSGPDSSGTEHGETPKPPLNSASPIGLSSSSTSDSASESFYSTTSRLGHVDDNYPFAESLKPNFNLVKELLSQFEKASDSGTAVLRTLEGTNSTLKQLYLWEKKLYLEVKDEEKKCKELQCMIGKEQQQSMDGARIESIHAQIKDLSSKLNISICKELQHMIGKEQQQPTDGARIESIHTRIKDLSSKLTISVDLVDSISTRITNLRDKQLWSWLCQLIQGLLEMWRVMAECHGRQRQAIAEAKAMETIAWDNNFDDLEGAMQVKSDVHNLEVCFFNWMIAQKGFLKSLNCWLTKCILNEPEGLPLLSETGAPALFVVSRRWRHAIKKSWVMHVTGTMSELVGTIGGVCHDGYVSLRAKALEDEELELKVKAMERKDRRMRTEVRRTSKRGVIDVEDGELVGMVRPHLQDMFEAMAKYSAKCVETYEELGKLCEE